MTNLDSLLKSRDITLPTKVHLVKAMVFPVVMLWMWELDYEESWALKSWCFELWCWRRLLRVPWTARRSNQSILKEISPGCQSKDWCWSWNSNTLATWYEELIWKKPWCWERLRAGGEEVDRGWDGWMALPTQWKWVWVNSGSWWWTGRPGVLQSLGSQRVRHDWVTKLNWTELRPPTNPKNCDLSHTAATATAAKSLQSCLTLCDPIDGSPPGSPVPEILQARTLEWVAISFSKAGKWKVKVKSLSRVQPLVTHAAYQAPPSMGFSRHEC